MTNLRKVWAATLKRAGVPYFAPYELRNTFATRLSAGGVAHHMVTGDAEVLKLYSQAKLGMMRGLWPDWLGKQRAANFEHRESLTHIFEHKNQSLAPLKGDEAMILKG